MIVEDGDGSAKRVHGGDDGVGDGLGSLGPVLLDNAHDPLAAVLFALFVELLVHAVGIEDQRVARLAGELHFVVFAIVEQPDGHAFDLGLKNLAVAKNQRRRGSGVRKEKSSRGRLPQSHQQRGVLGVHFALEQSFVQLLNQLRRIAPPGERPQQARDQRSVESGRRAFSAHVAEGDDRRVLGLLEETEHVAGDLARRAGPDARRQTLHLGILARQQDALELARGLEILIHALLALGDFFVQAGVFHRARDLLGQQRERALVILGKERDALAFDVQHAHDAVLHDQRNRQLRADARVRGDIARVGAGIEHAHRLARFHGRAGNALSPGECCRSSLAGRSER